MSLEFDITEIRRLLKEEYKKDEKETFLVRPALPDVSRAGVETMPETEPITKPDTAPSPAPQRHPMQPEPGVTPKPKALVKEAVGFVMNADVELFFRRRGKQVPPGLMALGHNPGQVAEADDSTDMSSEEYADPAVHGEKMDWIQAGGSEKIKQLMPGETDAQVEYVCTVASEAYNDLVNRIKNYTGIKVTKKNIPELAGLLTDTLRKTIGWEMQNKDRLEDLALDLVLSVPEYKVAEEMYTTSKVKFDVKIDTPDLRRLLQPQPKQETAEETPEEGLTPDEQLNLEVADALKDISSEEDLRRKFANLMITGGTINKLYLYNMVAERLNSIDPNLVNCYGVLSCVVQLLYWITPMNADMAMAGSDTGEDAAGSEEVIPEGDIYVIKARGKTFPFLVHEISKGISEWLSLDPSLKGAMEKDTLEDETEDMMVGPGVYKTVVSYIPGDKQELIPMVQKKLIAMGPAEIRDVLGKTSRGKSIMAGLIADSEKELGDYRASKEDFNEEV